MKILILSDSPFGISGYSNQIYYICCFLKQIGYEIHFICKNILNKNNNYDPIALDDLLTINDLSKDLSVLKNIKYYRYNNVELSGLKSWSEVNNFIKLIKPDILFCFLDLFLFTDNIIADYNLIKCCYIPIHDNMIKSCEKCSHFNTICVLRQFDKIFVPLEYTQTVLKYHGIPSEIIYHIQNDKIYYSVSSDKREELKKTMGIPEDKFVVLIIARLSENNNRKNICNMIEAYNVFRNNHDNTLLYLHLSGHLFKEVDDLIAKYDLGKNIIETDRKRVNNNEYDNCFMNHLYNVCDVLLHCSESEGVGLSVIDAQLTHCPVITTNCTAMTDITYYGVKCQPDIIYSKIGKYNSWSVVKSPVIVKCLEIVYNNNIGFIDYKNYIKYNLENNKKKWIKYFSNISLLIYTDNNKNLFHNYCDLFKKSYFFKDLRTIPQEYDKSVVIFESRCHENLHFTILNSIYHTDSTVGIEIVCCDNNFDYIMDIINDYKLNGIHIIKIQEMNDTSDYNRVLTNTNLYNLIRGTKICIMQTDAILVKDIPNKYFEYDYLGALWNKNDIYMDGHHISLTKRNVSYGNGGLSIRNVNIIKKILENEKYTGINEDVFFSEHMLKYKINRAPDMIAHNFSSETIYNKNSIGYHGIFNYYTRKQLVKILSNYLISL